MIQLSDLIDLIALNEQAYVLANGGVVKLPDGFGRYTSIVMTGDIPFVLRKDSMRTWGFVTEKQGCIYIVLRGTEDLPEWILDAIALPTMPYEGGLVHRDFLAGWQALFMPTINAVNAVNGNLSQLHAGKAIVTGHSLGAAMATLCAAQFGAPLIAVACPRVGDKAFAAKLSDALVVVNDGDIVPHLPAEIFGFCDHGTHLTVHGPSSLTDLKVAHALSSYRAGIEALIVTPLNLIEAGYA